jgi:outer membrane lipoprotein SlyB
MFPCGLRCRRANRGRQTARHGLTCDKEQIMTTPRNPFRLPAPRAAGWVFASAAAMLLSACAVPVTRTTRVIDGPGYLAAAPVPDVRYGTVTRIEEIDTRVGNSGGGAALGAVIGGVFGNQVGHGTGRAAATALGAVAGAVVGDNTERSNAAASNTVYRVHVRFDDGSARSFDYRAVGGLYSGERVRLQGGVLDRA